MTNQEQKKYQTEVQDTYPLAFGVGYGSAIDDCLTEMKKEEKDGNIIDRTIMAGILRKLLDGIKLSTQAKMK